MRQTLEHFPHYRLISSPPHEKAFPVAIILSLVLLFQLLAPKKQSTSLSKTMLSLKPCKRYFQTPFLFNPSKLQKQSRKFNQRSCNSVARKVVDRRKLVVRGCQGGGGEKKKERQSFLTLEEAGLVEISGLSIHEQFLCRLTISSLNLLRVIAEQEEFPIEELNAGRICDWFVKDKLKREQNLESAVLQWDDSDFQL